MGMPQPVSKQESQDEEQDATKETWQAYDFVRTRGSKTGLLLTEENKAIEAKDYHE